VAICRSPLAATGQKQPVSIFSSVTASDWLWSYSHGRRTAAAA